LIRNREKHVGVARSVERAVARQVAPPQLPLDVIDRDGQSARKEIVVIVAHRFCTSESQRIWVAPLGWPGHDDDVFWEPRPLAT